MPAVFDLYDEYGNQNAGDHRKARWGRIADRAVISAPSSAAYPCSTCG